MKNKNRKKDPQKAILMRRIIAETQLTREELAEKVGVSSRMIYFYLQGRSEPCASVYCKILALAK